MRRKSNLLLYLLLNVIVSAATTLAVLYLWDQVRPAPMTRPPQVSGDAVQPVVVLTSTEPAPTLPPPDVQVIQIDSVIAAGDLTQESVLLRRVGEGNLLMTGWTLTGDRGSAFTLPPRPELILYQGGAVEILTRDGDNTATEVYWNRTDPAWHSGETLRLLDSAGNERAVYKIP